MATKLDAYIQQCSQLAQQMGIKEIVLVARDPQTGDTRLVASPGAKESLRGVVATQMDFSDAVEIGWPGADT